MIRSNLDARKFQRDLEQTMQQVANDHAAATQDEVERVWDRLRVECAGQPLSRARERVKASFQSVGIRFQSAEELDDWTNSILTGQGIDLNVRIRWQ